MFSCYYLYIYISSSTFNHGCKQRYEINTVQQSCTFIGTRTAGTLKHEWEAYIFNDM